MRFTTEQLNAINEIGHYAFNKYFNEGTVFDLADRCEEYIKTVTKAIESFDKDFIEKSKNYNPLSLDLNESSLEQSIIEFLSQVHDLALSFKMIDLQEFSKKSSYFFEDFWLHIENENYVYDESELEKKYS